jgi:1-deoxy-D-xylulose-5-phosphate synthase
MDARYVKPLDEKMILHYVHKLGNSPKIMTLEEGTVIGGFGSSVQALLNKNKIPCIVNMIGLPDLFMEHATQDFQRKIAGLDKDSLKKEILSYF